MEYERTVSTVANAYVKPVVNLYLENLEERLEGTSVKVLRSDGGLSSASVAKEHCASLLYSVSEYVLEDLHALWVPTLTFF
jgi:5-oxoprolinase (ATP-hydrolysing)